MPSKAWRRADRAGNTLPTLVDAVKALAHPGRLRMLAMLQGGDLCVCQMTAVLDLAASTVSSHLSDLRRAGLVTERKSGKWVHYHLIDAGPLPTSFAGRFGWSATTTGWGGTHGS